MTLVVIIKDIRQVRLLDVLIIMSIIKLIKSVKYLKTYMDNQKDNTQNQLKNKALETKGTTTVSNYYNVFDHDVYVSLATRSQKIVTAVYMLTDFLDQHDPMRLLMRENATHIMRDLFSLIHSPKASRVSELSAVVNSLFAQDSYLSVVYDNGFISDMNYNVVSSEVNRLQNDVKSQITKSLPYDKKKNNNVSIRDFSFGDSFFGETKRQVSTKAPSVKSELVIKDKNEPDVNVKKTSIQSPVFVTKKVLTREALKETYAKSVKQKIAPKASTAKEQRKENILKILKQKRNASINDICALFKDCSSKTIQRDLSDLIESGMVIKEGSRRWSTYNLSY